MMVPLNVFFRAMERDEQVVWEIDAHVQELEEQCDSIIGCDVVVYGPDARESENHDRTNGLYDARVVLSLPCQEIVVERGRNSDTNVYTAIENAFRTVHEQFEQWLAKRLHLHEESL